MDEQTTKLIQDIHDRLKAMPEAMTEAQVKQIVADLAMTPIADLKAEIESLKSAESNRLSRYGNGDEKLIGSKFARWGLSVADIEWLYDTQQSLKGQKRVNDGFYHGPSEDLENAWKAVSDAHYLTQEEVRRIDKQAIDDLFPRIHKGNIKAYEAAMKAMDTAESGYGLQLVGAQYVGDLWEAARNESRVFGLINTFEMTAPTAYLPVEVDFPEMLYVSESTANNSSNYTTVKTGSNRVSASAAKFVIHQMWSGEMEEDSIIPFVPFLRRQAGLSLSHYSDSLALNGDTTNSGTGNINLDDADPADTKHYLAFDGIRHGFIVDATGQGVNQAGAITFDALYGLKTLAVDATYYHDWGHPNDPSDFVYVADYKSADKISLLDEFKTVDQYGPVATVLRGEQGKIGMHPLISSMAMGLTEADGKLSTTGSNNVKGQVAAFNRRALVAGWRRRVRLETERLPATDQTRIVYSLRLGLARFTPSGAASGIRWVAGAYNITV